MTRPKTPFEAASYDLIKFRERRVAERRSVPRDSIDRRTSTNGDGEERRAAEPDADANSDTGANSRA
jgi:hypothetical protein